MLNWLLPATGPRQLYRIVDAMLDTQIILSYAWQDLVVVPRRTLPPQALVVALTPLLDDRAATALLDLRARGFDLSRDRDLAAGARRPGSKERYRTSRTGCGGCAVTRSAVASSERAFPWPSGTTSRHSRLPWRRWKHFAGRHEPRACRHRTGGACASRQSLPPTRRVAGDRLVAVVAALGGIGARSLRRLPSWAAGLRFCPGASSESARRYAVFLSLRPGTVDARAPMMAAAFFVAAELSFWSIERRNWRSEAAGGGPSACPARVGRSGHVPSWADCCS